MHKHKVPMHAHTVVQTDNGDSNPIPSATETEHIYAFKDGRNRALRFKNDCY